jgi:chromate transporter
MTHEHQGEPGAEARPVPLKDLATVNLVIGLSSFGGGLASWFYREMVERRRWLDHRTFLSGMALNQILPGPSMVNFSLYFGFELRGFVGAMVAWLSLIVPPSLLALAIYGAYGTLPASGLMQFALEGVAAAAVGLNIATGVAAGHRSRDLQTIAVAAAVFAAVAFLHLSILWVVLAAIPLSLAVTWWRDRHE